MMLENKAVANATKSKPSTSLQIPEKSRAVTYDEIKVEFKKHGFRRPFRKVVEDILKKIDG